MTKKKLRQLKEIEGDSYSFNKTIEPFPEPKEEKAKPPVSPGSTDNSSLFKVVEEELSIDDKIRLHLDIYRKAERMLVINFYTGGGPYKRGILDSIYRGYNPMNP